MNLYDKIILPKVIHWVCGQNPTMKQREKVIPLAKGNVLEIGVGSGLNIPYYKSEQVKHLTAIDPSDEVWNEKKIKEEELPFEFEFIKAIAESIPIDSNSIDSIVVTYALCSIPESEKAFEEFRRVLKPNGQLIFSEHGKAPDRIVQQVQNLINPIWGKLGGGCSLTKDIPKMIESNGFKLSNIEAMYIPGWKPASFNYWGTAKLY
ncbi:MAG: methyltransferase domain-containing protein [Bacteroidetes bacterium]|nr:methyltransferase domain-containing protein [Bacteroidota bacterium]